MPDLDPLRPAELVRRLAARRRLAREVRILAACPSTSDLLKAALAETPPPPDGLLLAAESQTGGRGRRARDWWSGPPASNLAVSLLVDPPPHPGETLGLLAACALAAALRPWTEARIALKWPNDLLLDGAKIAGVLVEMPAGAGKAAILGMGVNVHAAPPAAAAAGPVTCLADRSARLPDRTVILAAWLWEFEMRLARLAAEGPQRLEGEFLELLRAWAPHGVRMREASGSQSPDVAGPVLEFSVSQGLTWGPKTAPITRPLGWIPALEPLPPAP